MAQNRFLRDLDRGRPAEQLLADLFTKAGFPSKVDLKARSSWDVTSQHKKDVITTEVKFDAYEARSGNIAIEVFNPRLGAPSGITVTEAFFWAHVLVDNVVWLTPVSVLKKYIDHHDPTRIIPSGGDDNATLYLYPGDAILTDAFKRVDDISPSKLKTLVLKHWKNRDH